MCRVVAEKTNEHVSERLRLPDVLMVKAKLIISVDFCVVGRSFCTSGVCGQCRSTTMACRRERPARSCSVSGSIVSSRTVIPLHWMLGCEFWWQFQNFRQPTTCCRSGDCARWNLQVFSCCASSPQSYLSLYLAPWLYPFPQGRFSFCNTYDSSLFFKKWCILCFYKKNLKHKKGLITGFLMMMTCNTTNIISDQ